MLIVSKLLSYHSLQLPANTGITQCMQSVCAILLQKQITVQKMANIVWVNDMDNLNHCILCYTTRSKYKCYYSFFLFQHHQTFSTIKVWRERGLLYPVLEATPRTFYLCLPLKTPILVFPTLQNHRNIFELSLTALQTANSPQAAGWGTTVLHSFLFYLPRIRALN